MPDIVDTVAGEAEPARREDLMTTAFFVEQDFRRLVETLRRMMEIAEATDKELIDRLASTRSVAERGLRLSKNLLNLTRKRRD